MSVLGDDWEHEEIFTDDDEAVGNDPEEREDLAPEVPAPPEIKEVSSYSLLARLGYFSWIPLSFSCGFFSKYLMDLVILNLKPTVIYHKKYTFICHSVLKQKFLCC